MPGVWEGESGLGKEEQSWGPEGLEAVTPEIPGVLIS